MATNLRWSWWFRAMHFAGGCFDALKGKGVFGDNSKNDALRFVLAGVALSVFVSISIYVAVVEFNLNNDLAAIIFAGCGGVLVYRGTNEKFVFGKTSIYMILLGVGTAIVGHYFILDSGKVELIGGMNIYTLILSFINVCIITPFFEELAVRGLLFTGLARLLNIPLSSLLVSLLFAYAHLYMFGWAFFVSMMLCFVTGLGVKTINRALFHGSYNAVVLFISLLPVISK